MDVHEQVQQKLIDTFGTISTISIIKSSPTKFNNPEAIKRSSELNDKFGKYVRASAIVVAAAGLQGVCSHLLDQVLVLRQHFPLKTFRDCAGAAHWLQEYPGQDENLVKFPELGRVLTEFAEDLF